MRLAESGDTSAVWEQYVKGLCIGDMRALLGRCPVGAMKAACRCKPEVQHAPQLLLA